MGPVTPAGTAGSLSNFPVGFHNFSLIYAYLNTLILVIGIHSHPFCDFPFEWVGSHSNLFAFLPALAVFVAPVARGGGTAVAGFHVHPLFPMLFPLC